MCHFHAEYSSEMSAYCTFAMLCVYVKCATIITMTK